MRTTQRTAILWIGAVLLCVLGAIYVGCGFVVYLTNASVLSAHDTRLRWVEEQYVLRGKNPYDVAFAHVEKAKLVAPPAQKLVTRDATPEADLPILPDGVVYPPWSYATGIFFFVPSAHAYKPVYAALMALSFVTLAWWTWNLGRPLGKGAALLLLGSSFALASWVYSTILGNYPCLIVAFLIAAYCFAERKNSLLNSLLAGLFLGLALTKPTLAGPFILVFLVRRPPVVLVALAYITAGSLLVWWLTRTSPLEMLSQMFAASSQFVDHGRGVTQVLISSGLTTHAASLLTGVLGAAFGGICLVLAARQSLLAQFAMASVTARLWSYHYPYDEGILVFLLLALAAAALRSRERLAIASYLVVGFTLWAPFRITNLPGFPVFQTLVWAAAAVLLVVRNRRWEAELDSSPTCLPCSISTSVMAATPVKGETPP